MSQSGTFRKQARQSRQVLIEDSYAHGMAAGDKILGAGFVKYLVNYTLEDGGTKLAPRRGLQPRTTTSLSISPITDGYDLFFGCDPSDKDNVAKQMDIGRTVDIMTAFYSPAGAKAGLCYHTQNFADIIEQSSEVWNPVTHQFDTVIRKVPGDWNIQNVFLNYTDEVAFNKPNLLGPKSSEQGFLKKVCQFCMETEDQPITLYTTPDGFLGVYKELDMLHHFRYLEEDEQGKLRLLKYSVKSLIPEYAAGSDVSNIRVVLSNDPKVCSLTTRMFKGPKEGLRIHDCFDAFTALPNVLSCTLQNKFVGIGNWEYTLGYDDQTTYNPEAVSGIHKKLSTLYTFDIIPDVTEQRNPNLDANPDIEKPADFPKDKTVSTVLNPETEYWDSAQEAGLADETYAVVLRPYIPLEIDAGTAVKYGYNMLLNDPYKFKNNSKLEASFMLYGCLPKDPKTSKLRLDYLQGDRLFFELNFAESQEAIDKGYIIKAEYRTGDSDAWVPAPYAYSQKNSEPDTYGVGELLVDTRPFEAPNRLTCFGLNIRVPASDFMIHVTVSEIAAEGKTANVYADNMYSYSKGSTFTGTNKIKVKNYDLTQAQGMVSWKHRLALWGIPGAPNVVFTSDIDNPTYFPYPNNIIEYTEPVLHVVVFLDSLLVFTTSSIYQTSLATDGMSYITKQVVGDVNLTQADLPAICPVKNMLFYKVGNYYYMLVPSTKYNTLGQLQTAPVSQPINYFLDNFDVELRKILQAMYGDNFNQYASSFEEKDKFQIKPTDYSCFLDKDEVKINYGFHLKGPEVTAFETDIIFCLKYDTLIRAWSSELYELNTQDTLAIYRKNVVGFPEYVLAANDYDSTTANYKILLKVFFKSHDTNKDAIKKTGLLQTAQFLDTGYRDLNGAIKKRFREIQVKLNNKTDEALTFASEIYVDNVRRKKLYDYIVQADSASGTIIITPIQDDVYSYGVTTLEKPDTEEPPSIEAPHPINNSQKYWRLSQEYLSRDVLTTVRIKTTGKGYAPRFLFVSKNKTPYEIHGFGWVSRNMNAR